MPDATYVGAGMPCGNCGNPLTPGQPHKCGRTPDQPRDDGTHGTRWLAGKLPPDKEVVLAHHYDALRAAVSPDERLREAVAALPQYVITIQDREGYTYERGCAGQPMNYTGVMLADVEALVGRELKYDAPVARETTDELKDALREIASFDAAGDARFDYRDVIRVKEIAAAALAADREKPDGEGKAAAVDARTAEIVNCLHEHGLNTAFDLIARRFPNGGTPNAS